jgi:hypothetical protein
MTWKKLTRRLSHDDGNPLRRRSDRLERLLLPVVVAAFVVLSPLVILMTGAVVRADNAAEQQAQRAWHQVSAVVAESVPGPEYPDNGANSWTVWTDARWTQDGQVHVARVPVPSRTRAGSTVTVWLNRAGAVQSLPLTTATARDRVMVATVITVAALAALLAGIGAVGRVILHRRRLASWGTGWQAVEPEWSRAP